MYYVSIGTRFQSNIGRISLEPAEVHVVSKQEPALCPAIWSEGGVWTTAMSTSLVTLFHWGLSITIQKSWRGVNAYIAIKTSEFDRSPIAPVMDDIMSWRSNIDIPAARSATLTRNGAGKTQHDHWEWSAWTTDLIGEELSRRCFTGTC